MTLQKSIKISFILSVIIFLLYDYIPGFVLGSLIPILLMYMLVSTTWFQIAKRRSTSYMCKIVFSLGVIVFFAGLGYTVSSMFTGHEEFGFIVVFAVGTIIIATSIAVMSLSAFFKLKP